MDKETALKVLISLIENNKLILKTNIPNISVDEYNKTDMPSASDWFSVQRK